MLLSEQVRMIKDEEILADDTTNYDVTSGPGWFTATTKNITLSATAIMYIRFRAAFQTGDSAFNANARVTMDGVPILCSGSVKNGQTYDREIFIVLLAGSYAFAFQGCILGSAGTLRLSLIRVVALNFPDKQRNNYDSGNVSCPNATTTTVLSNQQFTPPATRKLAVGSIKRFVCVITVYVYSAVRKSRLKNPGESDDSGFFNWKLYLDGTQQAWTERREDWGDSDTNSSYGQGCHGRLVTLADPGTARTIRIDVYNGYGSAQNCRAYVEIILCPWILADVDYEPVSLDFSQGSTVYVILEPLGQNPTKYARVGKARFVSFGDATDYYKSVSGTGILSIDYTFETVEVVNSVLHVKGYGGCVSTIGVDVR